MSYATTILADAPSYYWKLNDPSGGAVDSAAGGANTGTYQGTVTRGQAGPPGTGDNATLFNGSTGYVSTTTSIVNPTNPFTLEGWFKTTSAAGGTIIAFNNAQTGAGASEDRNLYVGTDGKVYFGIFTSTQVIVASGLAYNDGNWHYAAGVIASNGNMSLYVDGALVSGPNANVTAPVSYTGFWRIAWFTTSPSGWTNSGTVTFFPGTLTEVAVYPAALTSGQVAAHYAAGQATTSQQPRPVSLPRTLGPAAVRKGGFPFQALFPPPPVARVPSSPVAAQGSTGELAAGVLSDFLLAGGTLPVPPSNQQAAGVYQPRRQGPAAVGPTFFAALKPAPAPAPTVHNQATFTGKLSFSSYKTIVANDAPNVWWRLNDTSTTAVDQMANATPGTYQGTYTQSVGGSPADDGCTATQFDGSTGYVQVTHTSAMDVGDTFSVEHWVRPNVISGTQVIYTQNITSFLTRVENTGTFTLRKGGTGNVVSSTTAMTAGNWYHLVVTKTGATTHLYMNGVDVTGTVTNQTMAVNAVGADIASASASGNDNIGAATFLNGTVQDVAIYNYVLTPTQVANHYQSGGVSRVLKSTSTTKTAGLSFTGAMLKAIVKTAFSAVLSFVGSLAAGALRTIAFAAGLSFTGAVTRATTKLQAAGLSFAGSISRIVVKRLTGGLSFTGVALKSLVRTLTAVSSFTGTLAKSTVKTAFSGVLSFVGVQTKTPAKLLAGGLSFGGAITRSVKKSLAAALSFTGTVLRSVSRALFGVLSFAGSVTKKTTKALSGGLTSAGAALKQVQKSLVGVLSFVGGFVTLKNGGSNQFTQAFTAGVSFSGSTAHQIVKLLAAGLSFVGAMRKTTVAPLTAALSFNGALSKSTNKIFTAVLSFSGALTKKIGRSLAAVLTFVGTLNKQTAKIFAAVLSFSGAFTTFKALGVFFQAALSFSASQTRRTVKSLVAGATFSGSTLKSVVKSVFTTALSFTGSVAARLLKLQTFTAALSFTGSQTRSTLKTLAGVGRSAGSVLKATVKPLAAALSSSGSTTKALSRSLAAVLSSSAKVTRTSGKSLAAVLAAGGQIKRSVNKLLGATLTTSGSTLKTISRLLVGAVSFVGATVPSNLRSILLTAGVSFAGGLNKTIGRALRAALSFVGSLFPGSNPLVPHRGKVTVSESAGSATPEINVTATVTVQENRIN